MPDTFKEAEVDGQINQLLSNQIHIHCLIQCHGLCLSLYDKLKNLISQRATLHFQHQNRVSLRIPSFVHLTNFLWALGLIAVEGI